MWISVCKRHFQRNLTEILRIQIFKKLTAEMGNANNSNSTAGPYKADSVTSQFVASRISKLSPQYAAYYATIEKSKINGQRLSSFQHEDDAKNSLREIGI